MLVARCSMAMALLDSIFYPGLILLLEVCNAGSTEDHPNATNLIQVLLLHIYSFYL